MTENALFILFSTIFCTLYFMWAGIDIDSSWCLASAHFHDLSFHNYDNNNNNINNKRAKTVCSIFTTAITIFLLKQNSISDRLLTAEVAVLMSCLHLILRYPNIISTTENSKHWRPVEYKNRFHEFFLELILWNRVLGLTLNFQHCPNIYRGGWSCDRARMWLELRR
jgi:hypothetical protein